MLGLTAAGGAASLLPGFAGASTGGEQRLAFRNVHTGENFDALFARGDRFLSQGLAELNHGLRDWRTGEQFDMDRRLMLLLTRVRASLGLPAGHRFELISGFRSPKTNAGLKTAGGKGSGVASHSQHMLGKATDVFMPGQALERLRDAAMAQRGGGVGYYPRDRFVHIDTAALRRWNG